MIWCERKLLLAGWLADKLTDEPVEESFEKNPLPVIHTNSIKTHSKFVKKIILRPRLEQSFLFE